MHPKSTYTVTVTAILAMLLVMLFGTGCSETPEEVTTLSLVQSWVTGNYNNVAQAEADMASDMPPEQMHRPMHQLFVPVDAPNIDGYIVFQQSSMDGSENPNLIFRHGLMQYLPDPDSDALLQRELYFKENPDKYKNLHRNPELLADVTLDDMRWDAGCDFYLRANEDNSMVSGPLTEGACVLFNPGTQKPMIADDLVEITATDYRFRGRYKDEEGNVVWGTSSDVLNTLIRQSD